MTDTKWHCLQIPSQGYGQTLELQEKIVEAKFMGRLKGNILLLVEHPPVFTLGRRGGIENLNVSMDFLGKKKTSIAQTKRGGNITYHGPGQLVVYPIVDLQETRWSVPEYVNFLEEVMIATARDFKVPASRNPLCRGIWVNDKKLGSIGIAVRHGISFHGLALNINVDLEPFQWINPCGLKNIKMTSFREELEHFVDMAIVRKSLLAHFSGSGGFALLPMDLTYLKTFLKEK